MRKKIADFLKNKCLYNFLHRVRLILTEKVFLERLFVTIRFFGKNGLANHAAAGAYGFLLSAAPTLLLVSFFLLAAFRSSPQAVFELIKNTPFLDIVIDQEWLTNDFFVLSSPGISGLISGISIFWAGMIFAFSLRRGLKIIFVENKKRNPVADNLAALVIELLVLIFALVMILSSRTAERLYTALPFLQKTFVMFVIEKLRFWMVPAIALVCISYCAYRRVPAEPPRRSSALQGSLFCVICYELVAFFLRILLNQARYNFLYGALGDLILLLVNVYFFFIFFFFGAQLAFVIDMQNGKAADGDL